jgi:hypothetical protein
MKATGDIMAGVMLLMTLGLISDAGAAPDGAASPPAGVPWGDLLFPRLGDWAVMKIGAGAASWKPGTAAFPEEVERSGFFDEAWKNPFVVSP